MAVVQRPRPRGNIPAKPRWTIERAAAEFKLAPVTLRKVLRQGGVEPDQGGCFSTEQITRCMFGDLHSEKVRKERQLVRKYEIENQTSEASLLNRSEIAKGLAMIADAMTSQIMASELTRSVKEDLLSDLATVPLVLKEVADKQTRLPRRNGSRPEEGLEGRGHDRPHYVKT